MVKISILVFNIFALCISLCAASEKQLVENEGLLDEAKGLLLKEKERDKAVNILQQLAKTKEASIAYPAKAILAREFNRAGLTDRALKVLEGCDDFSKLSGAEAKYYLLPFLELARIQALHGSVNNAFKMLDYAVHKSPSDSGKGRAAISFAETYLDIQRPADAIAWLNKFNEIRQTALKILQSASPGENYKTDAATKVDNAIWAELQKDYETLRLRADMALMAEECGQDYADYFMMRELYDKGDYTGALGMARKLKQSCPGSDYGQYASLCEARCLLNVGDVKEAEKVLHNFIQAQPFGLYRGEAWIELGKIELETNWDAKNASDCYEQAIAWFRRTREIKDASSLFALPDNVKKYAAPLGKPYSIDEWYRTVPRCITPKEIVNEKTAPWYLDENEKEALFMSGFLLMYDDKYAEAKERFSRISNLDSDHALLESKDIPNSLMRLKSACDQGFLQIDQKHLSKFGRKKRIKLFLADFCWTIERFDKAMSLCAEVENDSTANPEEKAYALFVNNRCIYSQGKNDIAEKGFQKICSDYPKTSSSPLALLYLGYLSNNRNGAWEKAVEYYERCQREYPASAPAECCLARCVYTADSEDTLVAWRFAQDYLKKYPNGKYSDAVKETISADKYNKFRR